MKTACLIAGVCIAVAGCGPSEAEIKLREQSTVDAFITERVKQEKQLAQEARQAGDFDEAIQHAAAAVAIEPDEGTYGFLALTYGEARELKRAQAVADKGLKKWPDSKLLKMVRETVNH